MPPDRISVPVKIINSERWAQLNVFGESHEVCAEKFKVKDNNFSFAGGHRVRLLSVKKNVHWKIPTGIALDIQEVKVAEEPPRRHPKIRGSKFSDNFHRSSYQIIYRPNVI